MKFTTIIVFLISVVVARHNYRTFLKSLLKSKGNLYTKVDNDVQNVMNNLFESLNLTAGFVTRSRIKSLLTMHYDLKSAAEKNYDVHDIMVAAAKPNISESSSANAIRLFEVVEKILDDTFNYSSRFKVHKKLRKRPKHKTSKIANITLTDATNALKNLSKPVFADRKKLRKRKKHKTRKAANITSIETLNALQNISEPVFADSKEFQQFIHDFLRKVDNISENDFVKSSTPKDVEDIVDVPNLELWQPPAVLELDLVNDSDSRRIFKGERTRILSYPFVVSVHLMGTFVCAGSLLTKNLVITAASCLQLLHNNRFYRENPRGLFVRVGSDYSSVGGEKISIMEVFFHDAYDPKTLNHNLVLLRLFKDLNFRKKQKRIKRISYERSTANLASNIEKVIIVGWGSRKRSNKVNPLQKMLVAQLSVYAVNECAEIYSKKFVTHKHFCAGYISTGEGACNKDVGGPGIVGGVLVGVVSFGPTLCGALDSPTVFTKLGYYAPWIDGIIETTTVSVDVRTTLYHLSTVPRPLIYDELVTRNLITPIYSRSRLADKEHGPVLDELKWTDDPNFQDIWYEDFTEDIMGMFNTTTTKLNPMQHPLVNKSLYPVHEINTRKTVSKYVTIPLTTSSTELPLPPQFTEPGPTTIPPSRTPRSTTEGHITDIITGMPDETFEHIDTDEITTALVLPLRGANDSYEDSYTVAENWTEATPHQHKHKKFFATTKHSYYYLYDQ
ncbi:uncharacterized protein LOC124641531 [Helicoverpa zea]|uniref:uncharacterized protein LOC124641531 n=1 Tax=Helicoverpa zea TaxID=7113 RepID=UPI001F57B6DB|nr:uncharacterized protein LOC124641531 [Helicoverpa zea]